MTASVFVDTSAWYACFKRRDPRHASASAALSRLLSGSSVYTSDYVFSEVVTLLPSRDGFEAARAAGEALRAHPGLTLLEVVPETRERAWRVFLKFSDHALSFADCTSFALIEEYGIRQVFTYDKDFRLLGRELVG